MTPANAELVRNSFQRLTPQAEAAGGMFYRRLFELDPKLRTLFRGDMEQQRRVLFEMLGLIVRTLDIEDKIVPIVHDLGQRHGLYGVHEHDYKVFGEALMWTLEQTLGVEFTPETRAAWQEAYDFMAETMTSEALPDSR